MPPQQPQQQPPDMLTKRSIMAKRRSALRFRQNATAAAAATATAATSTAQAAASSTNNTHTITSLRERIRLLEQANNTLRIEGATHTASSLEYARQITALHGELRQKKESAELERQRYSRRGIKFLGDLQRKMRRVAALEDTLADERQQHLDAMQEHHVELEDLHLTNGLVTEQATLQRQKMEEMQTRLDAAELESKIHRCALGATYRVLESIDERAGLVRILQLCRQYLTEGAAAAVSTPVAMRVVQEQQDGGETPRRRPLHPQTPVSLNRQPEELDGGGILVGSPVVGVTVNGINGINGGTYTTAHRPRQAHVNEFGSPGMWN